jgi:hypothetical protein
MSPRPMSRSERRFYAMSVRPESAETMAKLGFGVIMVLHKRLFTDRVMPVLQCDAVFQLRDTALVAVPEVAELADGVFAPA